MEDGTADRRYLGRWDVLADLTGRDGTEAFEDVGHSDEARDMLPKMLVGEFKGEVSLSLSPRPFSFFSGQANPNGVFIGRGLRTLTTV